VNHAILARNFVVAESDELLPYVVRHLVEESAV